LATGIDSCHVTTLPDLHAVSRGASGFMIEHSFICLKLTDMDGQTTYLHVIAMSDPHKSSSEVKLAFLALGAMLGGLGLMSFLSSRHNEPGRPFYSSRENHY
jgi:hypothetical protein